MKNKLKIAIIGMGRISLKHLEAISNNSKYFDLVAICDNNEKKLNDFQKFNIKKYNNYKKLLKNEELDLISICTPSGLHAKQSILASKNKINVICEKPMALKITDAKRMILEAKKNDVKLFIVKQNRFNQTLVYLKNLIQNNKMGKVYFFNSNVFWNRGDKYYSSDKWRGTKKFDGGALMNQASHYVDMVEWLFGPVTEVSCFMETIARKIEVEDSCVINFRLKNNVLGSLSVSMLAYEKNFEGSLTVITEKGTIRIAGIALNEIKEINIKNKKIEKNFINKNYQVKNVYGKGHNEYYRNVALNLFGKNNIITDGYDGIKSLQIIESSIISNKKNKKIKIPINSF